MKIIDDWTNCALQVKSFIEQQAVATFLDPVEGSLRPSPTTTATPGERQLAVSRSMRGSNAALELSQQVRDRLAAVLREIHDRAARVEELNADYTR